MTGVLARLDPATKRPSVAVPDRREATGLPPLPEDQTLIVEAARSAGLGPWVRYVDRADCMYCSLEAARVLGADPGGADATFLDFWSLIHPDHRDRVARLMEVTTRNPRPYAIEYAIVLPGGETRYVAETARPYFDAAGKLTHFLGAFQDITERRHPGGGPDMENFGPNGNDQAPPQALRLDAVSREIQALLDIIITSSELMLWQQEGELPETYRGYTRDIRRSGMDLKLILEELLASGEAGAAPDDPRSDRI